MALGRGGQLAAILRGLIKGDLKFRLPLIHHYTAVGKDEVGGHGERLCFHRALGVRGGMTACPGCARVWSHRPTAGSRVPSSGETDSQCPGLAGSSGPAASWLRAGTCRWAHTPPPGK